MLQKEKLSSTEVDFCKTYKHISVKMPILTDATVAFGIVVCIVCQEWAEKYHEKLINCGR
jgi:hypothetical protein